MGHILAILVITAIITIPNVYAQFAVYESEEYGFSIEYPEKWNVDDYVIEFDPIPGEDEGSIALVFISDKEIWDYSVSVTYIINDQFARNYEGQQYVDKLANYMKEQCDEISLEIYDVACTNRVLKDSQFFEIDGKKAYQITERWTDKFSDGTTYENLGVFTDVVDGNNVWSIDVVTPESAWPNQVNMVNKIINSFKLTSPLPEWIKNVLVWYGQGSVSDQEILNAIKHLVENKIIKIDSIRDTSGEYSQKLQTKIISLESEIDRLKTENDRLKKQLQSQNTKTQPSYDPAPTSSRFDSQDCDGYADCFTGEVTEIIDGDTIKVAGQSIRFALVDTPEYGDYGYSQARNFIATICPVGSIALVDEDDKQTQGSYGRMIGVIYCNGMNLNKAVLDQGLGEITSYFCSKSEFEYHSWAQLHGCGNEEPTYEAPKYEQPKSSTTTQSCDPSYPDVCIPPYPPDLDCGEIPYKNFRVVGSDPHGFDGDNDGIGCEG